MTDDRLPLAPLITAGARMPSVDIVLTMIGLAVILIGIGYGVEAYQRAMREYRNEPLFSLLAQVSARVAAHARVVGRWLLRRPTPARTIPVGQAVSVSTVNPARPIKSGLPVPDDLPVEDQIRRLVRRVEQIEHEAAEDRKWYDTQVQHLRAEMREHVGRLSASDRELGSLARSVATDTAKLQAIGLILVFIGTLITLVPALPGFSSVRPASYRLDRTRSARCSPRTVLGEDVHGVGEDLDPADPAAVAEAARAAQAVLAEIADDESELPGSAATRQIGRAHV